MILRLLFIVSILYLASYVFRNLFRRPFQEGYQQQAKKQNKRQEGDVSVNTNGADQSKANSSVGEYIDYEDVSDEDVSDKE